MGINVNLPPNYNNEIQMSPFALCWIKEFIDEQADRVKRKVRVIEFGSGESTIWFDKTFPDIELYSVEGDREWYDKLKPALTNTNYIFEEQDANYRLQQGVNENYYKHVLQDQPFDLIINDGALREMVGDMTLGFADKVLSNGGIYLRHDYEHSMNKDWLGFGLDGKVKEELGYERFCAEYPDYSLITVSGNGKWGFKAELGGIYRRFIWPTK